ncbi:MAG: endonuclease/exonuclease/phosphatase family protein [Chloroflexota bacterium]|nr:endonuclease/exonuclease/phosphatase family protein [Chloroflexota bacterium]
MSLSIVNWNVQFATPRSWRTPEVLGRVDRHEPEIVCLTETHDELLGQGGYAISSQPDYGYGLQKNRRKVLLWSREPWRQVDDLGIDSLPPGRFVSGVTQTSVGEVAVIGICIPWFGSRTEARRGEERRGRWEDHEDYLARLTEVLEGVEAKRLIVMGDFNQAIGKGSRAPRGLQQALHEAFGPKLRIVTANLVFQGRKSIDHVALSADWAVDSVDAISNIHGERKLSDHFGVAADVSVRTLE